MVEKTQFALGDTVGSFLKYYNFLEEIVNYFPDAAKSISQRKCYLTQN